MILVQNPLRLLNGSKFVLFFFFLLFGMSSCDMFRKAQTDDTTTEERDELDEVQGEMVFNPETGKYEKTKTVIESVDTVAWVNNPDAEPPISSEATKKVYPDGLGSDNVSDDSDSGPGQKLAAYDMAVMLPFLSNRFTDGASIDNGSVPAISFYAGMKLAFDELGRQGIQLNADVYDTKGSEMVTTQLMKKPEVQDADLIIGPFRKSNVKIAGEMAKTMKIPFVSPISASSGAAKENPYFIQVNPYLPTHCQAITRHARERFKTEQIVLVARNKQAETSRFRYFQDENKKIEGDAFAKRFREYVITAGDDDLNIDDIDVTPYLAENGDTTVFIVPSFSNKNFVYRLLLQIYTQKGNNPVVVYGFPQWMEFEPPSYDYYELLNLHVSSSNYADPDRQVVKDFKRRYYDRFGTLPVKEAYVGYDVALYFGKMISKHGTKFQELLDSEREELLNTRFEFFREVPLAAALAEDFSKTNLYENKYVYILKFADYRFQKAD